MSPPSMDSLPPELLRMILTPETCGESRAVPPHQSILASLYMRATNPLFSRHASYLRLRLVSQSWNAIITPFAFSSLRTESTEASLTRLHSVSTHPTFCQHVRSYEFGFWREHCPPGLQHEFVYIQSLPDELKPQGYARLQPGETIKLRLEQYARQLEFQREGRMTQAHIDALRLLPNLLRLAITVGPFGSANLSDVPSRMCRWGPAIVETFFRALGDRVEQTGVRQVEELRIEGLTGECLLLPPNVLSAALRGVVSLQRITLLISGMSEPSLSLLGRILQSATGLQELRLSRLVDADEEQYPDLLLRSLFSPPRVDRSCQARDPTPPPIAVWKKLTDLTLSEFVFTPALITEFVAHHPQLEKLVLSNCYLKPSAVQPCDHHSHSEEDLVVVVDPETETWRHVFRSFRSSLSQPLKHASFSMLTAGREVHSHLSLSEGRVWAELLTGRRTTEPEDGGGDQGCDDCGICNPPLRALSEGYWDEHSDSEEEEEDDDDLVWPWYDDEISNESGSDDGSSSSVVDIDVVEYSSSESGSSSGTEMVRPYENVMTVEELGEGERGNGEDRDGEGEEVEGEEEEEEE